MYFNVVCVLMPMHMYAWDGGRKKRIRNQLPYCPCFLLWCVCLLVKSDTILKSANMNALLLGSVLAPKMHYFVQSEHYDCAYDAGGTEVDKNT
jgi:hypothetical protein